MSYVPQSRYRRMEYLPIGSGSIFALVVKEESTYIVIAEFAVIAQAHFHVPVATTPFRFIVLKGAVFSFYLIDDVLLKAGSL